MGSSFAAKQSDGWKHAISSQRVPSTPQSDDCAEGHFFFSFSILSLAPWLFPSCAPRHINPSLFCGLFIVFQTFLILHSICLFRYLGSESISESTLPDAAFSPRQIVFFPFSVVRLTFIHFIYLYCFQGLKELLKQILSHSNCMGIQCGLKLGRWGGYIHLTLYGKQIKPFQKVQSKFWPSN
jgi:hypothetical protein